MHIHVFREFADPRIFGNIGGVRPWKFWDARNFEVLGLVKK